MRRIAASIVAFLFILSLSSAAVRGQTTQPRARAGAEKPQASKPETAASAAQSQVAAKRALATRMPATKFDNVRLEDAILFLQDSSGANIHVNWRALETVNITRESPITVRLQPLSLRQLLRYVLAEADAEGLATFYVEEGVIEVTTREMADQRLVTKVYPVEDLLLTIPDFNDAPQFQLQQQSTGRGGGGGGSSQGLFGQTGGTQEESAVAKNERGQELVQLIMETVQPDVWRENGGTASIRFFRGKLIVTAPRSVHEQIGGAVD